MRALHPKPLWKYLKALDSAKIEVYGDDTAGSTGSDPTAIHLILSHPSNWTTEGRIDLVGHEIVHQVHGLSTLADKTENDEQEAEIEKLVNELSLMTEWVVLVVFRLEEAMAGELHAQKT